MRSMSRSRRAVVADDDGAFLPAGENMGDGRAALGVEIVGRLVEEQEVGIGEEQRRERNPRLLAAAQRCQSPVGIKTGQADVGEGIVEAGLQRPVGFGCVVKRAVAGRKSCQPGEGFRDAEAVGDRCVRVDLDRLAKHADAARSPDRRRNGARSRPRSA